MPPTVTRLAVSGFRSLSAVDVPLDRLTVLVGPNGAGKTNVLNVLRFLSTTVRFDLQAAVDRWGGLQGLLRRSDPPPPRIVVEAAGIITKHARATSPDQYRLTVSSDKQGRLRRSESFSFKRYRGPGRKITVDGSKVEVSGDREFTATLASPQATGLSTLPRLGDDQGGEGIRSFAEFLSTIRVLEPDVRAARHPGRILRGPLADDASNLASALLRLQERDPEAYEVLQDEMQSIVPGLQRIAMAPVSGSASGVVVQLKEKGLREPIDLADASFGTVRALSILCALHEPEPPALTVIEEIDHGLHPYALDILVDRLRAASSLTQLLLTSHSPTLVNRLEPEELVICRRDAETGASIIPALTADELHAAADESDLGLGELWFGGAIDGVPA